MSSSLLPKKAQQRQRSIRWTARPYISHRFLIIIYVAVYVLSTFSQASPHLDRRSDILEPSSRISSEIDLKHERNGEVKSASLFGLCLDIRGGGVLRDVNGNVDKTTKVAPSPESIISQFLSQGKREGNSVKDDDGKFHIQGWRWHTLSFTRDSTRLQQLATRMLLSHSNTTMTSSKNRESSSKHSLALAINHVIDFNLKGLQRVENDLFFPWLRKKLTEPNDDRTDKLIARGINDAVFGAFQTVLDEIDYDRKQVAELAERLVSVFPNDPLSLHSPYYFVYACH